LEDGPVELVVGIEMIGAEPGRGRRGLLLSLAGRREGPELVVEQVSSGLSRVQWELLMRYLSAPLAALRGSVFPPDELVVMARSSAEAELWTRAAEAEGDVRCITDGLSVRCRGGLGDARAASRALLRAGRALLGKDAEALWSGAE
jgi:hypothetical protein